MEVKIISDIKINKQITFLRRQMNVTQEELALALGVTNQAVSKWESAQCCPDIQLLPDIAEYFNVSIDELMVYKPTDMSEAVLLKLRNIIETLPDGKDFKYTLKTAYTLHAIIMSKLMTAPEPDDIDWNSNESIAIAGDSQWGFSCINLPEITTIMKTDSVLFSGNKNLMQDVRSLHDISSVMECFGNISNLKIINSIYKLTVHDVNSYVPLCKITADCGLSETEVNACIENHLLEFIIKKLDDNKSLYRIKGMYMHLIPVMTMFSSK